MSAERVLPARVWRFYRGGSLIGRLRGEPEPDGEFPEDWIGSTTRAVNPGRDEPDAGLARLEDGRLLRDAVAAEPERWLGRAHLDRFGVATGLLAKLLDPAERLPVHAHPDRAFARARLDSRFGKTEAWAVVATREPEAEVWLGLREPVEPAVYRRWIDEQDSDALLGSLNRVPVRAGDVVYVPAGVPHAIGPGALIVEAQEPTDFLLLCERRGYPIAAEDAHLGLGWDVALGALDLGAYEPRLGLPPEAAAFFWLDDVPEPAGRFAVLLVLEGEGEVDGLPARPGDAFVLPAAAGDLRVSAGLRLLRCLAPDPEGDPT